MSLASSPGCLFRPEDKALKMLFPSIGEPLPNAFDDFLNGDLYDLSDDNDNKDGFAENEGFFLNQQLVIGAAPSSSIGAASVRDETAPQPWRQGLWCLNEGRGSSEIVVEKRRDNAYRKYEVVQRTSLRHNNNCATLSPRSPPTTSSHPRIKKAITSPRMAKPRQNPYVRQQHAREVTLSPSPMYAKLPQNMGSHETWQQDFQNFHLQIPKDKLPLSPPLSGNGHGPQASARQVNSSIVAQNATAVRYAAHHGRNHYNAIDPGLIDPSYTAHGLPVLISHYENAVILDHQYAEIRHQQVPVCTSEDPESSSNSQYSYDPPANMMNSEIQTWWSPPMNSHHVQAPVAQHEYYQDIAAPMPQRLPHQILQQYSDIQNGGLGIHYPELVDSGLPDLPASSAVLSPLSNHLNSFPPLSPPIPTHFTQIDPFSTPRDRQRRLPPRSTSRSPSPSISPTNTTRTLRQRSPTRTDYNHNRRKSLHKPGPIKDKDSNSSKPPRTPRTPKTPTNSNLGFDFVNFTPKDSVKLLSDVAPSGSSKTRARREAEAKDKRKRLSEAAVQAVRRAGGDVAAIEKAILT